MASESRTRRLAVLIDAENMPAAIANGLFKAVAKIGDASVRRIYGDFSGQRLKAWADASLTHAIVTQQVFANPTGKNAADFALVIDAMDMLHSGQFQGFCLVSSDSDFTRLALRIREAGLSVFGFGEQKTPQSFRNACTTFADTENLVQKSATAGNGALPPGEKAQRSGEVLALLRPIISGMNTDDGWVYLSVVASQVKQSHRAFNLKKEGYKSWSKLVSSIGEIETDSPDRGVKRIRLKRADCPF